MRAMLLSGVLAFAAGCGGDDTGRFTVSDAGVDVRQVDAPPSFDLPSSDRAQPDRAEPDILDLTDVRVSNDAPSDAPCAGSVAATVSFGDIGGNGFTTTRDRVEAPRTFVHTVTSRAADGGTTTCMSTIPGCNTEGQTDVGEVAAALAHPDVERAFAAGAATPALYGYDPRPVDGAVYDVQRGDAHILIGEPCRVGGMTGCVQIPIGLQRLVDVLRSLSAEAVLRPDCRP